MALPKPGEERLFGLPDIEAAVEWANAGGIAIHRGQNLEGEVIGGRRRFGPTFHVYGHEAALLRWGRRHGLQRAWLHGSGAQHLPYFAVFGSLARHLDLEGP